MTFEQDYAAIREHAGIGTVAERAAIAVAGRDRASFLQGFLTNDIQALTPGTGCYAAWLTPQGRMLEDVHVLESGDMLLLDVPAAELAATLERLERFLFSEDVQLQDLSATLAPVWLHGPAAPGILSAVAAPGGLEDLAAWASHRNARTTVAGAAIVVARIDQLGVPGFCLYVGRDDAPAVTEALAAAGASRVGAAALEACRIEAGYPLFGIDMTSDTIPLEASIESRAISFSKGCYVGQEVVIRVLHRGQGRVAKKLVTLRVGGGADGDVPTAGAAVLVDARDVGRVTSAARSPRFGAIALAYVHRDFLTPGTVVDIALDATPDGGAGARRVTATVSETLLPAAG